jgi:hypothetical protein
MCAEHPFNLTFGLVAFLRLLLLRLCSSAPPEVGFLAPPPPPLPSSVPPTVEIRLIVPLALFTRRVRAKIYCTLLLEQSVEHLKGTGQGQILGTRSMSVLMDTWLLESNLVPLSIR